MEQLTYNIINYWRDVRQNIKFIKSILKNEDDESINFDNLKLLLQEFENIEARIKIRINKIMEEKLKG